jgi:hypothetical protein
VDVAGRQEPLQCLDQANAPTLPELLLALPQDDETFERLELFPPEFPCS